MYGLRHLCVAYFFAEVDISKRISCELVHRFAHRDGILTIRLFISAIFNQSAGDRRAARNFDGGTNNNQVSTCKYLMPLVFKALSIKGLVIFS